MVAIALAACGLAGPRGAAAESKLHLAYPDDFGTIPAATYDAGGKRVGDAQLLVERLPDDNVRILARSGIEGGARTIATATLATETVGDNGHTRRALRLLTQESRSFDPDGIPLGVLSLDHEAGVATCSKPNGHGETVQKLALPAHDRIVNVPLHLLFLPLVDGERDTVDFQLLLCRTGPRLVDFQAHVAQREPAPGGGGELVEIRYAPDLGPLFSFLAQPMVPKLSIWFDPRVPNRWVGHRVPLYSSGPEIMVVRDGVSTRWLIEEQP